MSTWVVAMVQQQSGGRYDDRPWPPPGYEFEVPGWEGEGLVASHTAVKIRELAEDRPVHVTAPAPVSLPAETAAGPAPPEPQPGEDAGPAGPEPPEPQPEAAAPEPPGIPKPSDPKQAWIGYAVSQGMPEDQAAVLAKADLMSRFGGRL